MERAPPALQRSRGAGGLVVEAGQRAQQVRRVADLAVDVAAAATGATMAPRPPIWLRVSWAGSGPSW